VTCSASGRSDPCGPGRSTSRTGRACGHTERVSETPPSADVQDPSSPPPPQPPDPASPTAPDPEDWMATAVSGDDERYQRERPPHWE
jgi:hypothetical protein